MQDCCRKNETRFLGDAVGKDERSFQVFIVKGKLFFYEWNQDSIV